MRKPNNNIVQGEAEFTGKPMGKWFDPGQLFQTDAWVLIPSIFSTYADKRGSFMATGEMAPNDYSDKVEIGFADTYASNKKYLVLLAGALHRLLHVILFFLWLSGYSASSAMHC